MSNMDQKQQRIPTDEILENLRKLSFYESKLQQKARSDASNAKSSEVTAGDESGVKNVPESEDSSSATSMAQDNYSDQNQDKKSAQDHYDIALSFAKEDEMFAQAFEKLLLHESPDLKIHKSYSDSHSTRMNIL